MILFLGIIPQFIFAENQKIKNIPRFSHPPKIDGMLEGNIWEAESLKIEGFLQFSPVENGTPTEKTIAYIGYDKKNLYIAFHCYDSEPDKLRVSVTNRDNIMTDDWVAVFFLGIDNNLSQNNLGKYNRDDYSVFLKFSYWHRI